MPACLHARKHLGRFLPVLRPSGIPKRCFPCFSIPLGNFLPKTVPRCIARGVIEAGATRYRAFRVAPGRYAPVRKTVSQQMAKKLTDDVNYRGFAPFLGTVSQQI